MKNIKSKLILLVLLGVFFSSFAISFVKADTTYTTIEKIEEFSCTDDAYVDEEMPDENYGDLAVWFAGEHGSYEYWAFFKFNLTDKPEGYIEAEVVLTSTLVLLFPILVSDSNWTEESITWNTIPPPSATVLPFSLSLAPPASVVHFHINITDYADNDYVSFVLVSQPGEGDYASGFSKEHTTEDARPKVIWTYEVAHTIEEPSNLLENIIFGSVGLIIGIIGTAILLLIKLRKRGK